MSQLFFVHLIYQHLGHLFLKLRSASKVLQHIVYRPVVVSFLRDLLQNQLRAPNPSDFRNLKLQLEPRMLQAFPRREALLVILSQHSAQEVFSFLGNLFPVLSIENNLLLLDVFIELLPVPPVERRVATKKAVDENTQAPDIAFFVIFPVNDLWGQVERGSDERLELPKLYEANTLDESHRICLLGRNR